MPVVTGGVDAPDPGRAAQRAIRLAANAATEPLQGRRIESCSGA